VLGQNVEVFPGFSSFISTPWFPSLSFMPAFYARRSRRPIFSMAAVFPGIVFFRSSWPISRRYFTVPHAYAGIGFGIQKLRKCSIDIRSPTHGDPFVVVVGFIDPFRLL